jgi:hypothetical protein
MAGSFTPLTPTSRLTSVGTSHQRHAEQPDVRQCDQSTSTNVGMASCPLVRSLRTPNPWPMAMCRCLRRYTCPFHSLQGIHVGIRYICQRGGSLGRRRHGGFRCGSDRWHLLVTVGTAYWVAIKSYSTGSRSRTRDLLLCKLCKMVRLALIGSPTISYESALLFFDDVAILCVKSQKWFQLLHGCLNVSS